MTPAIWNNAQKIWVIHNCIIEFKGGITFGHQHLCGHH